MADLFHSNDNGVVNGHSLNDSEELRGETLMNELDKLIGKNKAALDAFRKKRLEVEDLRDGFERCKKDASESIDALEEMIPPRVMICIGLLSLIAFVLVWFVVRPLAISYIATSHPGIEPSHALGLLIALMSFSVVVGVVIALAIGRLLNYYCCDGPCERLRCRIEVCDSKIELCNRQIRDCEENEEWLEKEIRELEIGGDLYRHSNSFSYR